MHYKILEKMSKIIDYISKNMIAYAIFNYVTKHNIGQFIVSAK